jgi:hypothetical protein
MGEMSELEKAVLMLEGAIGLAANSGGFALSVEWARTLVRLLRQPPAPVQVTGEMIGNAIVTYHATDGDWSKVCAEILSAAALQAGVPSVWLPIETAPKDGTRILVAFKKRNLNGGVHAVSWGNLYGEATPESGVWCVDDQKHGPYPLRGYLDEDVIGWMPLPAAQAPGEGR